MRRRQAGRRNYNHTHINTHIYLVASRRAVRNRTPRAGISRGLGFTDETDTSEGTSKLRGGGGRGSIIIIIIDMERGREEISLGYLHFPTGAAGAAAGMLDDVEGDHLVMLWIVDGGIYVCACEC